MIHPQTAQLRLAMMIDGDNADANMLDKMIEEAQRHGTVTVKRIYGDWTQESMSRWAEVADRHGFQTPHQLAVTKQKNSTDMLLVIDAMDEMYSGHVDGFCIASSDSDFAGLVRRISAQGMFVMGIGNMSTPESFRRACHVFTYAENISDNQKAAMRAAAQTSPVGEGAVEKADASPPDWKKTIAKAIEMTSSDEWNNLASVGYNARKADSSFDPRTYGKAKLLALVRTAPKLFKVREEKIDGQPPVHFIKALDK